MTRALRRRLETTPSEEEVVTPEAPHDLAWVERAYVEHHELVWRALARIGVPAEQLEDALQEVFMVLHRRRGEFDGRSSERTWLFGIATKIGARLRDRSRRAPAPSPVAVGIPDPERALADQQALALVESALQRLRPERREVFVLCEVEGFSGDEVAELIGLNRNTVYSRLRLARRDFQQALEDLDFANGVGHG